MIWVPDWEKLMLWVPLKCPKCPIETLVPPDILQEISDYPIGRPKDERYVDFVCPECGFGKRHNYTKQEIPTPRDLPLGHLNPNRFRLILFHAFLRCEQEDCDTYVRIHTLRETEEPNSQPKIPISGWRLVGVRCPREHPARVPLAEMPAMLDKEYPSNEPH
jgi:hypothetical protein